MRKLSVTSDQLSGDGKNGKNGKNGGGCGDKCVTISVANLASRDAEFLTGVIDLFCNPLQMAALQELRAGKLLLGMSPKTGMVFSARGWPMNLPALE